MEAVYVYLVLILGALVETGAAPTTTLPPAPDIPVGATPSPIVFIPGKCGSQIEGRYDRESSENDCPLEADWHRMWLDVWQLIVPTRIRCWTEYVELHYNWTTRTNSDTPGVEFRIPGWGETSYSEYIDPSWSAFLLGNSGAYLVHTVNEFVTWGLERDTSIRVAPYDFRYSPHSHADYFVRLRELVEDTYRINDNKKVVILSHSMGGMYGQWFLQVQEQQWKDTYIHAYIPINTPWTGSALVAYLYTSGYNWGLPIERPIVQSVMRSFETAIALLPRKGHVRDGAWGRNDVLVQTPERNYTAYDFKQLFQDIDHREGYHQLRNHQGGAYVYEHPGVDTYCVYSSGVETPARFVFTEGQFPTGYADIVYGPGDGTVDIRSLRACESFLQKGNVGSHLSVVHELVDMQHIDLLYDRRLYDYIKRIVFHV